ncbi:MAG TPA: HipA family kinase [Puia sp.]|jgi:hypothetical protein|nr:HipA family kinase [Puia sp.]
MLPIYNAISFQRVLEKGGRTKPWLVLVNTGTSVQPYVVKLFETALIEEKDSVTSEVLGNILAREFDLHVPDAALINMGNSDFTKTIQDPALLKILDEKDNRLKFGSSLLDGFYRFDASSVSLAEAKRMIEIDTLFAFDNLIRNPDRNNLKPNLLVKSDQAFLIDHELGFEITDTSIHELKSWQWKERFFRYHIFYNYLKNSPQAIKKDYFDEFGELLVRLNVKFLEPYFEQLANLGFSRKNGEVIRRYLSEMKQNSTKFVSLLKGLIS